ncbi:hypothetical protein AN1V17_19550 [Vallitalea sediminicola]
MEERRKYKRLPIKLELEINSLFKQNNDIIKLDNKTIEVIDISKNGIGILCRDELPLNYYFNAKIEFDPQRYFYCVLKIIRSNRSGDKYSLGCEFVGLAEFLADKVDEYEEVLKEKE